MKKLFILIILIVGCKEETIVEHGKTMAIDGTWTSVSKTEPFVDMYIRQEGTNVLGKAEVTTQEHWYAPQIFTISGSNDYPNIIIHLNKRQEYKDHQEFVFVGVWISENEIKGTIKENNEVKEIVFIKN